MKYVKYQLGDEVHWGALEGADTIRRYRGDLFETMEPLSQIDARADATLLAPVSRPRIYGAGLNYVSHIAETGSKTPKFPMLFMKPDSAVIGPGEAIVYPREGTEVHFEAELAAVIGRTARRVNTRDALEFVLGYTCANDVSERPIQFAEMAMGCLVVGKGYDTFCPIGPVIETDIDPADTLMLGRVNGVERQRINTSDLLFSVAELVSYLSQAITLSPGDVILTGTPAGVGPVMPGDWVEIEIEGIGILENPVVAEASA